MIVRQKCMAYILAGKDYFKSFVPDEPIEQYCLRKSQLGVWGDDVELQALSEIYDRPIEIYAYSIESMRTFHEQEDERNRVPIRLSYHGKSHYNSVVPLNWQPFNKLEGGEVGSIEDFSIQAHQQFLKDEGEIVIQAGE